MLKNIKCSDEKIHWSIGVEMELSFVSDTLKYTAVCITFSFALSWHQWRLNISDRCFCLRLLCCTFRLESLG